MARYRILAWKGIPTSVRARDDDGGRVSRALPDWFAQEVDRRAMADGTVGSDAYLEAYEWSAEADEPGDAAAVADAVVRRLVTEWDREG